MDKETLEFIIDRYDHYYDSVNNKGQFFLGLNTFIIGSIGATYILVKEKPGSTMIWLYITMAAALIAAIASVLLTLMAILPYQGSKKSNRYQSIIFFKTASALPEDEYLATLETMDHINLIRDLSIQSYYLATGLTRKYAKLTWAGTLMIVEFLLIVPFIILIINNLK